MIPKLRVFVKAGTKPFFGGHVYDEDQMIYDVISIDVYHKEISVWGCDKKYYGIGSLTYDMEDVNIMMSTKMKDKNGIEIYEYSELDGVYEVIFKDLKYNLRYIPNNYIIDLHDYWRDKNGEIEVTREYTKV